MIQPQNHRESVPSHSVGPSIHKPAQIQEGRAMDPHPLVGEIGDYALKLLQMEHREQLG